MGFGIAMIPIVLHHGLFGYDQINIGRLHITYFRGIDQAIRDRGHPLIIPRVHPCASVAKRAEQLKTTILDHLAQMGRPGDRVVVIAHSLGGRDARYMLSKLDMADRVAALVTITTPHRGTPYADWCVRRLGHTCGGLWLAGLFGIDIGGILDLTTEHCRQFNDRVPDAAGVRYFSVSAARQRSQVPLFARHAHRTVFDAEGENDSLVSVQSSTWATHLGVWPADHWHTINRHRRDDPTGDIVPYYLDVLDRLRDQGVWN